MKLLPVFSTWPLRLMLISTFTAVAGCGDIYLDAPKGAQVRLMAEKAPAKVHQEQVVWFKYWGNEPFFESETHAATIIRQHHLEEARIRMVSTFADGFISTFTGPFGFPRRTLVVEGNSNAGPAAAPSPAPEKSKE